MSLPLWLWRQLAPRTRSAVVLLVCIGCLVSLRKIALFAPGGLHGKKASAHLRNVLDTWADSGSGRPSSSGVAVVVGHDLLAPLLFRHAARHNFPVVRTPPTGHPLDLAVILRSSKTPTPAYALFAGGVYRSSFNNTEPGHPVHKQDSSLDPNQFYAALLSEGGTIGQNQFGERGEVRGSLIIGMVRNPIDAIVDEYVRLKEAGQTELPLREWALDVNGGKMVAVRQSHALGIMTKKNMNEFFHSQLERVPRHHALPPGVLAVDYLFPADREAEAFLLLRRILGRAGWRWDLLDLVRLESTPSVGAALRKRLSRAERRELMRHQSGGTRSSLDMQLWQAATKRLDILLDEEYNSVDHDRGTLFEFELESVEFLNNELARRCSSAKPLSGLVPELYKADAVKWERGFGRALINDPCYWYNMDAAVLGNLEDQANGLPGQLFSPVVKGEVEDMGRLLMMKYAGSEVK